MTRYVRISTPSRSASAPRLGVRPHVEADDHRVRRGGEHDVVLGDSARGRVDDGHAHLCVLDLLELGERGLDRAGDVGLEDDVEVLNAFLHALEEDVERDRLRALGELLPAQALAAGLRVLARLALVLDDARVLAGGRRLVEADDLDRIARPGVLELLAVEVVERAHAPPGVARDDRVADVERAAVDEHRRHRPAPDVEPRLDDRP